MITTRIITSIKGIEDACALIYDVYIKYEQWKLLSNNPVRLRIETKNNRKLLVDRFTDLAIWFGAFDGETLVGCARLCGPDESGKFEMECYPDSLIVRNYLDKNTYLEMGKVTTKIDYKGDKIIHRLYLIMLEYCEINHYSMFCGTNNLFIKSLFKRIEIPIKIEQAFKYVQSDSMPVNFYLVNYETNESKAIIKKLKQLLDNGIQITNILDALELFADILPAPFYWHDTDGTVLGINERCLEGMGTTREKIIGKTPYDFYPKEIAEHILKHNEKIIRTGEVLSQEEVINNFSTGDIIYALAIKAPLYDNDGNIVGIVGTSIDITAEKEKLQREIETYQAEQKLQARFKSLIDEITHSISSYQIDTLHEKTGTKLQKYHSAPQITLTRREEQTLYYLSMYKGPKEIASILSLVEGKEITASTVQSVIDKQLYRKFEVNSIGLLMEKAKALKIISFKLD